MTITTRSFVRLAVAGLFANFLAIACVVSDDDGGGTDDSCTPGDSADCTCKPSNVKSTKECNASGTGYGLCACAGVGVGGAANNGGAANGSAGDATITGGTGNNSNGGADMGVAGDAAGGVNAGGAGGGENVPLACQLPSDICEDCYYGGCCDQWAACEADATCGPQFLEILACARADQDTGDVTTVVLEECGKAQVAGGSSWSDGLSPLVKPVVDCMAGEPGWEGKPWAATGTCNNSCFKQL